jgi:hypothetical protein
MAVLNWLFLSRKLHWDIIILAQDADQIDKQARTTLCDYLVQSSRLDRQKIPYLAPLLDFLLISSYMPRVHIYDVYYGFSTVGKRIERWSYTGEDIYNGYDTNQRFLDGHEIINNKFVDMRATFTYLPACYLSGHIYRKRLEDKIEESKKFFKKSGSVMAMKSNPFGEKPKLILMSVIFIGLVIWMFNKFDKRGESVEQNQMASNAQVPISNIQVVSDTHVEASLLPLNQPPAKFVDILLSLYRPRISTMLISNDRISGYIHFYKGSDLMETLSFKELHAFGIAVVKKPYGVDLITSNQVVVATAWPLSKKNSSPLSNGDSQTVPGKETVDISEFVNI